ncbi:long-chain fatty acid--CoA ligase [Flavobacteriaceae bacterium S356]|uniref:Long-chain fatty acid--CoA ligase n=1 Tax=Asprobacillus argus TaxID=3076534 RepID=A0ABU3LGF3_9FLAO|nr:long-chain fatty acid--CoA ligase [Flavobacteriaceae bacterium S356]
MNSSISLLFDFPRYQMENTPLNNCFVYKSDNVWKNVSTEEYIELANNVSRSLLQLGINPGDKIAVITTNNQPKWHILDIGILQTGALNVPLYATLSEKDYAYILNHSDAKYCFVSDNDLFKKVTNVKDQTQLIGIYSFEELDNESGWESFLTIGKDEMSQSKVENLKSNVLPTDLATIIYTSGTTGTPKGVMLSHQNLVDNIYATADRLDLEGENKRVISYLPICHVFERAASYYYQYMGFEVYFAESIETLGDTIREVKPHFLAVVPRLLEKIFDKIVDKGSQLSGVKKKLFFWALSLGEQYKPYRKNGAWYHFKLGIAKKLIFSKWRQALGGELQFMLSGSAPLQDRLIRVFTAAGIPIFEGYGMTESSPGATLNDLRNNGLKIGTVGKPLKGVAIKIAEDGEILIKGHNVMQGYYKNGELTQETIQANYLHTGDIGKLDTDGFLTITDRKKEIFKTSGGKYIAPAVLESELKKSRFIEQVMVIGESQKMPAALIQVNFEFVQEWAKRKSYPVKGITTDQRLIDRIQKEIDTCNHGFGKWEQIKKFEITPDEWSVESGHLTPTLKMRRKIIKNKYQSLFDKIYAG